MKTLLAWIAVTLLALSFPSSPAYAQWTPVTSPTLHEAISIPSGGSAQDDSSTVVKYRWNTTYTAKLTISGLVSASDVTYGNCALFDNGIFACYEDEHGRDRNYTGTYTVVGSAGNRIQFTFDSDGVQEYKSMLTDWAEELAGEEGMPIGNISYKFTSFRIPQITISKKTNLPGSVTLTIRGKVSATLDGDFTTKSFSYTSKITFQNVP